MSRFKQLVTYCGLGQCPTITRDKATGNFVIIGKTDDSLIQDPAIKAKIGEGETAVIIPEDLLVSFQEYLIKNTA